MHGQKRQALCPKWVDEPRTSAERYPALVDQEFDGLYQELKQLDLQRLEELLNEVSINPKQRQIQARIRLRRYPRQARSGRRRRPCRCPHSMTRCSISRVAEPR